MSVVVLLSNIPIWVESMAGTRVESNVANVAGEADAPARVDGYEV